MDIKLRIAYVAALVFVGSFLGRGQSNHPGDPMPHCLDCTISSSIPKERAIINDGACSLNSQTYIWNIEDGNCQRFECSNGHYYTFGTWTWVGCNNQKIDAPSPLCPANSCAPTP